MGSVTRRSLLQWGAGLPITAALPVLGDNGIALTTAIDAPDILQHQLAGQRVAILTHVAGVNRQRQRSVDILAALPGVTLQAIWSPEHGFAARAAAGAAVADDIDAVTTLPIHSLYGARRAPDADMLRDIDTIFIDLQDVGVRPYTYAASVRGVLAAAGGRRVLLNDRPNPIGGMAVEGPVLTPELTSFVGVHPVSLRHGMTLGEYATMLNVEADLHCDLGILRMSGWRRDMAGTAFAMDGLPLIPPSPNLPTIDAMLAYAGFVLVEGTNISEGRGTMRPFQRFGAPFVDGERLAGALQARGMTGAHFTPCNFTPTSSKYAQRGCGGVDLHIDDARRFQPVTTALHFLTTMRTLWPDAVQFLPGDPPFFDLLAGVHHLRRDIQRQRDVDDIIAGWQDALRHYVARRQNFLLY